MANVYAAEASANSGIASTLEERTLTSLVYYSSHPSLFWGALIN